MSGVPLRSTNSKASKLVFITFVYILINVYSYLYYLYPVWGYQGFAEFDPERSTIPLIFASATVLLFAAIYPRQIDTYSRFAVWFIFYFVFTPSLIIVSMQGIPSDGGYRLIAALALSMVAIAYLPELFEHLRRNRRATMRRTMFEDLASLSTAPGAVSKFEPLLFLVYGVLALFLLYFYAEVMSVVSITDVYEQRDIVSEFAENRSFGAYLLQWMVRLMAPFMIAVGIIYKRPLMTALGLGGMAIGYFATGSKFILFLIPLIYGFHYFVLKKAEIQAEDVAKLFTVTLAAALLAIAIYGEDAQTLTGTVLSQIVKRAFSINGMTLGNYYDFFINNPHPLTYYSHLGPVRGIVEYPYGDFGIGQMVGFFQVGKYTYDMSAGFWSTDGIAALGLAGVVLIGIVLGGTLTAFNFLFSESTLRLLCLSSLGCIWMLSDTSIFRVVLSGAWPVHFLLVYLFVRNIDLTAYPGVNAPIPRRKLAMGRASSLS